MSTTSLEKIPVARVHEAAQATLSKYPGYWQKLQQHRLKQFAEEISFVYSPGGTIIDLGGGEGLRSAICVALGMKAICADEYRTLTAENDYLPQGFLEEFKKAEDVSRSLGVEIVHTDFVQWKPDIDNIAAVMSFDAMEHIHHSPRGCFKHLVERLASGGILFIGVPNAANILKRFRVLAGGNAFSKLEDWYFCPLFAGHVREPTVEDLMRIAQDLSLSPTVFGRNWLGLERLQGRKSLPVGQFADHLLRRIPTFCSDIYLYGEKRADATV